MSLFLIRYGDPEALPYYAEAPSAEEAITAWKEHMRREWAKYSAVFEDGNDPDRVFLLKAAAPVIRPRSTTRPTEAPVTGDNSREAAPETVGP